MDSLEYSYCCSASPSATDSKNLELGGVKPPCDSKCLLRCSLRINPQRRQEIFNNFHKLETKELQQNFIAENYEKSNEKYRCHKSKSFRGLNNSFFLKNNIGERRKVCKTFFAYTLGITEFHLGIFMNRILNNYEYSSKKNNGDSHEKDSKKNNDVPRRKYSKRNYGDLRKKGINICQYFLVIKEDIRKHIDSIPKLKNWTSTTAFGTQHHQQQQQQQQSFIEKGKTIKDLYRDYVKKCLDSDRPHGTYGMYRRIFTEEFKIFILRSRPLKIKKYIRTTTFINTNNKNPNNNNNNNNKPKKKIGVKNETAKDLNRTIVAHYKLQTPPFTSPRGKDPLKFYHTPKFEAFNFTVCELQQSNDLDKLYTTTSFCYFWNEGEGRTGSSEIGSCLLAFVKKKLREGGIAPVAAASSASDATDCADATDFGDESTDAFDAADAADVVVISDAADVHASDDASIAAAGAATSTATASTTDNTGERDIDFIFYSYKNREDETDQKEVQQFNHLILSVFIYTCLKYRVRSVTHAFLNDDENECDRIHSAIETRINNSLEYRPIYQPCDYFTVLEGIEDNKKDSYEIQELKNADFLDLEILRKTLGIEIEKNEALMNLNEAKIIKIEKDNPEVILYKTTFEDELPFKEIRIKPMSFEQISSENNPNDDDLGEEAPPIDSKGLTKSLSRTDSENIVLRPRYRKKPYIAEGKIGAIINSLRDEIYPYNYIPNMFYEQYLNKSN
nr:MAG: hypothetical protein [Porcellio scaber clopovirus]